MPLTSKGRKIMSAMKEQYGAKKGERVFYASRNAGKIKGVDPESRARGGHVDAHEAREKELIGELARMNRHRAQGGHAAHTSYIVGEKGPEMFVPDEPGTIIPHHELRRLARKYGGRVGGRHRAGGGLVGLQVEQFPGQRKHR